MTSDGVVAIKFSRPIVLDLSKKRRLAGEVYSDVEKAKLATLIKIEFLSETDPDEVGSSALSSVTVTSATST